MPFAFHPGPETPPTRARRGALHHRPRPRGDAGLHAGRHARHRDRAHARRAAALGAEIVLGNTYHLLLRPGPELVPPRRRASTASCGWTGPVLTDSGGFQIFSLAARPHHHRGGRALPQLRRLQRMHLLSPERVDRDADRDRLRHHDGARRVPPLHRRARPAIRAAMERTHRWALRSLAARTNPEQALFAIVQGGLVPALRAESARVPHAAPVRRLRHRRARGGRHARASATT